MKKVQVYLTVLEVERLREESKRLGIPVSECIRRGLDEWLGITSTRRRGEVG